MKPNSSLVSDFADRVFAAMQARKMSERQLCGQIGKSPTYLRTYLTKKAKRLPEVSTLIEIANALSVSVDYLITPGVELEIETHDTPQSYVEIQAQRIIQELFSVANERLRGRLAPTIDDVLNWLGQTGGLIHQDNAISQYVDLHCVPAVTDSILNTHHVGQHSLASQRLGAANADLLRKMMESLPEEQISKVLLSYRSIEGKPFTVSREWISVEMPEQNIQFETEYYRLLHEVEDAQGGRYILCFSTMATPSR